MKNIFVGTSGFSYKTWIGKFYPKDLPVAQQLEFYCKYFNSVEINNSFYHLPKKATYESWRKRTSDEFRFTIKGSRYITQFLALNNTHDAVIKFFEPADALKEKLEMVLWQLSPARKANEEDLKLLFQSYTKIKSLKNADMLLSSVMHHGLKKTF